MSFAKRWFAVMLALLVIFGAAVALGGQAGARGAKTGVGLSEHAWKAYEEGWQYQYGSYGEFCGGTRATDCAGLIKSYLWWVSDSKNPQAGAVPVAGGASAMLQSASASGTIRNSDPSSLPRVHGLILYQPGHVGVYLGNNMAVDNRDVGIDVCYEPVFGRAKQKWTMWFKLPQIEYPTTGWETFQGERYYYENGEYIVNTTRTIDGVTYSFGSDGVAKAASGVAGASMTAAPETSGSSTAKAAAPVDTSSSQTDGQVQAEAKERAARAIEERMAALESTSSEASSSEESLDELISLGLSGGTPGTESSLSSMPQEGEELVFADGVIPKASAKTTVFDAPQKQAKGMNSILAMLIVVAATGVTAAIVIPRRIHLVRKHGRVSKKRVFRGFRNPK